MDRAKILNQVINQIKQLREEGNHLFSNEIIVPKAEYMIEEFFEAKFNPFLEKVSLQIHSLPHDEYIIVSIDTWIKDLNDQIKRIENSIPEDEYAEVLYIRQKYIPILIDKLSDIKLDLLEHEFNAHDEDIKKQWPSKAIEDDSILQPDGIALVASLLYNHRIMKSSLSIDDICDHFSKLSGYPSSQIKKYIGFDDTHARLVVKPNTDDLLRLQKVIKAMGVRVDSIIAKRKGEN